MINLEHPWFLVLLVLLLLLLIFRQPRYFLRYSYLKILTDTKKMSRGKELINSFPSFFKWLGWLLIVLAAIDYTYSYQEKFKKEIIHNYVLINDGSGSMVADQLFNGVGAKLSALLKGNDVFLKTLEKLKRADSSKDFVGVIVFSDDPFIVSYLIDDYDFVRQKLFQIDWRVRPYLNNNTEINKAIWAGINLILKKNADSGGLFFTEDELINLKTILSGANRMFNLSNFVSITKKLPTIKKEITGSSLILFTDGLLNLDGNRTSLSVLKLLLFCQQLDIRVYLISVSKIEPDFLRYIQLTGGEGMIVRDFNQEKMKAVYEEIVIREAGEYITVDREQKKSYADLLASLSLALLLVYSMLRNTISRSLTEI